jgi:hypothetical protein
VNLLAFRAAASDLLYGPEPTGPKCERCKGTGFAAHEHLGEPYACDDPDCPRTELCPEPMCVGGVLVGAESEG